MERSRRLVYSPPIIQEGTDCSVGILQSYGCRSYSQHFCCCLQHQPQGKQEHTDVLWHVFINIHNTMKSIVLGDILLINGGKKGIHREWKDKQYTLHWRVFSSPFLPSHWRTRDGMGPFVEYRRPRGRCIQPKSSRGRDSNLCSDWWNCYREGRNTSLRYEIRMMTHWASRRFFMIWKGYTMSVSRRWEIDSKEAQREVWCWVM